MTTTIDNGYQFNDLGRNTYMLLQVYECLTEYVATLDSNTDSYDADAALLAYVTSENSKTFRKKTKERHNVLKKYCEHEKIDLKNIQDYHIISELSYILNENRITEETIDEYFNLESTIVQTLAQYFTFKEKESNLQISTKENYTQPIKHLCFLYKNALKVEESLARIVGNQIHSYRPIFDQMHRKNEDFKFSKTILNNDLNKEYEKIVPYLQRLSA